MFRTLLAAAAVSLAMPAAAQVQCGPPQAMSHALTNKYGEHVEQSLPCGDGATCERWINEETGTWSWVVTRNGRACLVAAGNLGERL